MIRRTAYMRKIKNLLQLSVGKYERKNNSANLYVGGLGRIILKRFMNEYFVN
jgi:hypothetical protein